MPMKLQPQGAGAGLQQGLVARHQAVHLAISRLPRQQQCKIHRRVCAALPEQPAETATAEEVEYKDGWTDIAFIALCRKAYGSLAGWQSERSWREGKETFAGMVEGKTAAQQKDAVIAGFPQVPAWFRKLFPYSKWGAELNAKITPAFFTWLVGPMESTEIEVNGQMQQSGVHIKKCRYLAESQCVGMCVNLCKSPVQTFFTEQLGMPLTMEPNFEDMSCEMKFGVAPPPLEEDTVMQQPCFAECASGKQRGNARCHKLQ